MKNALKYSLMAMVLGLCAGKMALAKTSNLPPKGTINRRAVAPEIDPTLALSAFALLGGSAAVMRARLRK